MPDFKSIWMVAMLAVVCYGCDASVEQKVPQTAKVAVVDPVGAKSMDEFHELKAQRLAAGDTVAIPDTILKKLVGDELPGFDLEINKNATFTTRNFTFSEATKVFYDSAEDYREITAGDYVANPDFFEVIIDRFNQANGVESNRVLERRLAWRPDGLPEEIDFFGWETFNRQKQVAQANFGLDYRYFISVEGTGIADFFTEKQLKNLIQWEVLVASRPQSVTEKSSQD